MCKICNDTGIVSTPDNDSPCDCPAGDKALFVCSLNGKKRTVTGAELKEEYRLLKEAA